MIFIIFFVTLAALDINRTLHPPFGAVCGCNVCSSALGCPEPITAETTFPLLESVDGLDRLQKEALCAQLKRETKQIMMKFYALISEFYKSLKEKNNAVDDLKTHLKVINAYANDDRFQSVFLEQREKLRQANTLNDLFDIIEVFCSFFNYDLIEYLIKFVGSNDDKMRLNNYKSDFAEYARRRVCESPPKTGACSAEQSNIYVKLESGFSSLCDLREFRLKISEILSVSQYVIRLCCIEKGCIRLTFQIPHFLKKELFPLTPKQEDRLKQLGATRVTCGDYEFQVDKVCNDIAVNNKFNC